MPGRDAHDALGCGSVQSLQAVLFLCLFSYDGAPVECTESMPERPRAAVLAGVKPRSSQSSPCSGAASKSHFSDSALN